MPDSFVAVTPQGAAIANLSRVALALSALVFALVVGVLAVALIRDHHRPGDPDPEQIHGNRRSEDRLDGGPGVAAGLHVRTDRAHDADGQCQPPRRCGSR